MAGQDEEAAEPDEELQDAIDIEELQDTVPVTHRTSDDYGIHPASGARGGPQPRGQFKLDFIVDYTADPEREIHELTEQGIGDVQDAEGEVRIIREKQTGVVMSPNNALSVACWIIAQILGPEVSENDIADLVVENFDQISRAEEPV